MRRFARPDLLIRGHGPSDEATCMAMIQRIVEAMIAGGSIPEGQTLRFPELGMSVTCRWQGGLDDPLFYNFWIELAIHRGKATPPT